jgi:hypothetical protein
VNVLYSGGVERRPIVYGLVDPDEPGRIRYVGQTFQPYARYCAHVGRRTPASPCGRWIRNLYLNHDRVPSMVLLEEVPSILELREREREWIKQLVAAGQADLNRNNVGRPIVSQSYFSDSESELTA